MKKLLHILCLICLALTLLGCSRGPRVIPRGKMAKIYAEMLVTDQWIYSKPRIIMMADTSLVYEPILQKYGYTSEDYRHSVEHYMNDPERFAKIMENTSSMLGKRLEELKKLQKEIEESVVIIKTNFKAEDYFPFLSKEPFIHYYDSLTVECDTLGCYRMVPIECSDTTYDGLNMIVKVDTLKVKDSLMVKDSLEVKDSLKVEDIKPLNKDMIPELDLQFKKIEFSDKLTEIN